MQFISRFTSKRTSDICRAEGASPAPVWEKSSLHSILVVALRYHWHYIAFLGLFIEAVIDAVYLTLDGRNGIYIRGFLSANKGLYRIIASVTVKRANFSRPLWRTYICIRAGRRKHRMRKNNKRQYLNLTYFLILQSMFIANIKMFYAVCWCL